MIIVYKNSYHFYEIGIHGEPPITVASLSQVEGLVEMEIRRSCFVKHSYFPGLTLEVQAFINTWNQLYPLMITETVVSGLLRKSLIKLNGVNNEKA